MTLEITYEPDNEEVMIVLDDAKVLKATLGNRSELILNDTFQDIEDEDQDLYIALRKIVRELFTLTDV